MKDLEFHPLCKAFDVMDDERLDSLAESIKQNGLLLPITLLEGKILDGRNRYLAAQRAGVELQAGDFMQLEDWIDRSGGSPKANVLVESLNLLRRQLNPSQAARCAVKLVEIWKAQGQIGPLQAKAAKAVGATKRLVKKATRVTKHGTPQVLDAVDSGKMRLETAEKVIKRPKREQRKIMAKGPAAAKASVAPASRPPPRGGLAAEARAANMEAEAASSSNGSVEETHEVLEALDACWEEHKPHWNSHPTAYPGVVYKALRAAAEAALLRPEAR